MSDHGTDDGGGDAGDQPTVTVGSAGFQPGDEASDQSTSARADEAVQTAEDVFGWRGWLLVSVLAVCFLVLPVVVALRPVRLVGFRTTYLVLPLVPAFLLGATAVWAAVRSRQREP